ncbi:MAG TPA: hypothetical protein VFT59_00545 [Candidatus Saccharimonadales bacterium]|nr:hypothetical protein [Candidatus Saccharimonadales bacterium]
MEQEPQRELEGYFTRIAYWLKRLGHLAFILASIGIFIIAMILLLRSG